MRIRHLALLALLAVAGCQSDKKPLLQLKDSDKDRTSNRFKDDKPIHREIIDEFGIGKGWEF